MKKIMINHKILFSIMLIVIILFALSFAFIFSKLSKLSYHDGTLSSEYSEEIEDIEDITISSSEMEDIKASSEEEVDNLVSEDEAASLGEADIILSDSEILKDKDVFNILLLGTDERKDEFSSNARADSIMILSLDKRNKTMKLVSLQRGMGVPILDGKYEGEYDWITHVFKYGGAALMLETVREVLNVDVEYYVRVNFNTFSQLIDSVGGVDIELTEIEAAALNGEVRTNAYAKHKMYEGANHLDGYDALQYARLRYTDSDWKRIERQRNVIQSVVLSAKDMNLLELNDMLDTVLPLIQTNLTTMDILGLISYAPAVLGREFDQMTIPASGTYGSMKGLGGRNLYAVDFKTNSEILHEFLYGSTEQ